MQVELIYALTFQEQFTEAHALSLIDADTGAGRGSYQSPLTRGLVHAAFSQMDAAFEHVQKAVDERDPLLMYLTVHPMFDTLRPDPRYSHLLRRMKL